MNTIRQQILEGNLKLPTMALKSKVSASTYRSVERMFTALWNAYLLSGPGTPISTPYWTKQIKDVKVTNIALKTLSLNGWIVSKSLPNNNWGEAFLNQEKLLEYVTEEELASIRMFNKFNKYMPNFTESTKANVTKIGTELLDTGLVRQGFMKTGNTQYQFDVKTMEEYKPEVIQQLNKGIDKMIQQYPQIVADLANYKNVGLEVAEALIYSNGTYTGGFRTNDPRGRNNRGDLDKIGNPVGFKIMRSLLVLPEQFRNKATVAGIDNVFLFIAEIHGFKNGTKAEKITFGQERYLSRDLPHVDSNDEIFEEIWTVRMYRELDAVFGFSYDDKLANILKRRWIKGQATTTEVMTKLYEERYEHKWSVPIEIDMSASVLGYIGLLLNHRPFMERCNMVGDVLTDAWAHDVITNRTQFKTIMRQCYGSQMSPDQMWDAMDIPYTREEVLAFQKELDTGELAVANAFKDFIIQECNPQAEMKLHVWDEHPTVRCNRYFNVGEVTTRFDLYDTFTNSIRRIHHTDTKRVPDLKSFRRYFVTGLIHGLDGNTMDKTVDTVYDAYQWAIDIHDAIILCPEAIDFARDEYAKHLTSIYENRNTILENYFRSIGIKASAIKRWKESVLPLVQPFEGDFKCSPMVLK